MKKLIGPLASLALGLSLAMPAAAQMSGGGTGGGVGGGGTSGGVGSAGSVGSAGGSSVIRPPSAGTTGQGSSPAGDVGASGIGDTGAPGTEGGAVNPTVGSSGTGGGVDQSTSPSPSSGDGVGNIDNGGPTTEERASEGSTSINSLNADAVARSGDPGAATTLGGSTDQAVGTATQGAAGYGAPAGREEVRIPRAPVAVDLGDIRSALEAGPSATPKADGR